MRKTIFQILLRSIEEIVMINQEFLKNIELKKQKINNFVFLILLEAIVFFPCWENAYAQNLQYSPKPKLKYFLIAFFFLNISFFYEKHNNFHLFFAEKILSVFLLTYSLSFVVEAILEIWVCIFFKRPFMLTKIIRLFISAFYYNFLMICCLDFFVIIFLNPGANFIESNFGSDWAKNFTEIFIFLFFFFLTITFLFILV